MVIQKRWTTRSRTRRERSIIRGRDYKITIHRFSNAVTVSAINRVSGEIANAHQIWEDTAWKVFYGMRGRAHLEGIVWGMSDLISFMKRVAMRQVRGYLAALEKSVVIVKFLDYDTQYTGVLLKDPGVDVWRVIHDNGTFVFTLHLLPSIVYDTQLRPHIILSSPKYL